MLDLSGVKRQLCRNIRVLRAGVCAAALVLAGCSSETESQPQSQLAQTVVPISGITGGNACGDGSQAAASKKQSQSETFRQQAIGPSNLYFAQPLCSQYLIAVKGKDFPIAMTAGQVDLDTSGVEEEEWISEAVSDSERKCGNFIGLFTAGQATTNASLDIYSLLLSGLATVFTPVNTVRALAAGSTIVQGSKTAVNTDVYQQVTMILMVQEITANYDADMTKYFSLSTIPNGTALVGKTPLEFATLQRVHRECSLPYAAAAVSQSQKQNTSSATPPAKIDVGTLALGAAVTYKGSSGTIYTVTVGGKANALTYTLLEVSNNVMKSVPNQSASQINTTLNGDSAQPID